MTVLAHVAGYSQRIPTFRSSDWLLRLPLAAIMIQQGLLKFPIAEQAGFYGLPVVLMAFAAFADIAGSLAILLGGLIRNNWMSDALTRLGGLAIAGVVGGVIWVIYWGPFNGWQFQSLLFALGAFFAFRGNGDVKGRSLI